MNIKCLGNVKIRFKLSYPNIFIYINDSFRVNFFLKLKPSEIAHGGI